LEQSDNPFAWIVMAHLKTQATKHNLKSRKAWKFSLMRQLYERGMSAQDIRTLYEFIDWTMILGEELEDEFWQELKSFEESQKMPYVTNAERIGIQKGELLGYKPKKPSYSQTSLIELVQQIANISHDIFSGAVITRSFCNSHNIAIIIVKSDFIMIFIRNNFTSYGF
jgi:hypothetical protein